MPADELTALQRAAGVVGELDPATAWDLDAQLDGIAQVSVTLAEGMAAWSERLHDLGLHPTVTSPAEDGVTSLTEIATGLTGARRALRTVYDDFFAAAEAHVATIARPAFWGQAAPPGRRRAAPDDQGLLPASVPRQAGQKPAPEARMATTDPASAVPGGFHPDQPRAADGKWVKVTDVLGYADEDTCHATDQVASTGLVPTTLALMDYSGTEEGGDQYVVVATPRTGRRNPLTWKEEPGPGDPDGGGDLYAAPQLAPAEAEAAAKHLDELAQLAESGYQPPKPTRYSRAAKHLQHLVDVDHAGLGQKLAVGDEDEFPLTVKELLALLQEKDPAGSAAPTRRKVTANAIAKDGGDTGTVWMDLETGPDGSQRVVVTAVEGTETPDGNREYASPLTPAAARELAAKLRAFARAARSRGRAAKKA